MPRTHGGESVLSRTIRIIEVFEPDEAALTVTEIARRTRLHIATASRIVEDLSQFGWLQNGHDRKVRIGVRLWELVSRASPTLSLREAAMPVMEDLHAIVGQHIQLGVMEGDDVLFVERLVEATSRTSGIGRAIRATVPGGACTAVGYYVATNTWVPLMQMYANDITLHLGVFHPRAVLPELLNRRTHQ